MVRNAVLVVCDRLAWVTFGLVVGVLGATAVLTQAGQTASTQPAPSQPPAPAEQAQAAPPARVLTGDVGLVLNFIKPDKTKDFEGIVAKLKDALTSSGNDTRLEQAKGWRVFKAAEAATAGAALYVFVIDPSVKDADYSVTGILGEATPAAEMTQLTKQYVDSYASGQNFVNLALVSDFGK